MALAEDQQNFDNRWPSRMPGKVRTLPPAAAARRFC
jgi:hypothetical protein